MAAPKTYLVCPLNWGLGHATRLMPIIFDLKNQGQNIILCGDGDALQSLSNAFPDLKTIIIKDISIRFSSKGSIFNLIKIILQLIYRIIYEHWKIKRILKEENVDVIISDNRYGLWNKKTHSIFITHQLMVKLPSPFILFEGILHQMIKNFISKYNECWIPDYSDHINNLSGDLSHKYLYGSNTKFIGPKSRFSFINSQNISSENYDIVIVLSGPEPARTDFENAIVNILRESDYKSLIIQGKPNQQKVHLKQKLKIVPHLSSCEIKEALLNSKLIICRSGYSSIMDLEYLKKRALLVPTPGQTEQEYLAEFHANHHMYISQKNLNIEVIKKALFKL